MKILKFGGSSVANPDRINRVIKILNEYHLKGEKFAVVFSAFGGITDRLIQMSQRAANGDAGYIDLFDEFRMRHLAAVEELIPGRSAKQEVLDELGKNHRVLKNLLHGIFLVREASLRTVDYVLSFGERNSAFIISHALKSKGIEAKYLDARTIIKTNKEFGSAKVFFERSYQLIGELFLQNTGIQIVTGFIASSDKGGLTTTLGRGGSDYTASILASALDADIIEIWTDVDGVLTADPRKVSKAFTIPKMTYAEAMEMSHFGAKVIYPPTLQPALAKNIPLVIRNTFNPKFEGTYISHEYDINGKDVKGISSINEIALLTLQGSGLFGATGTAGKLFNSLALEGINVILITQGSSEHSISFAVAPAKAKLAKKAVEKSFEFEIQSNLIDPVKIEEDLAVVAVIGENMRYQPGVAGRMFQALGKNGINAIAIAQGSSELNISVVIDQENEAKALNVLHEAYFLSDEKILNLFIVGVGLIGGTLLKQIRDQQEKLRVEESLELRVVGLANSKKMIFDPVGIDLNNWKELLLASDEKIEMGKYIDQMKSMNLSNSIFIDNTASTEIPKSYPSILDNSISISTPNKSAASSDFTTYKLLKSIAAKRGVQFLYETNVGAGLPVISTIRDLINSGDKILKIEGVLSGSLSYIFNSYNNGDSFGKALKSAMELGYTEPDPRVDLSGEDVKKKLLILGREIGLPIESSEIQIVSFLPKESIEAENIEAFITTVERIEESLDAVRKNAEPESKLCFIAKIDNGKAVIQLENVGNDHPFSTLSGSDNMIVITSERYFERPLVIRGPGAGAEVTAAGVFAEIIKIGHYF